MYSKRLEQRQQQQQQQAIKASEANPPKRCICLLPQLPARRLVTFSTPLRHGKHGEWRRVEH
ncbi:hypothetical protein SK128_022587 [Halocaridina rubra]|uniref:Uncharacterized protein n=1 Tax=Halocaridina rubra TaxID=373956 RepID=A0AAN8WAZ7_HALRR